MKIKKCYNNKGLTLIEVVLALALLSTVLITFAMGFSNVFTNIHKSKDITVETFSIQETIEREISNFSKNDLEEDPPTINIFDRSVPYKKIVAYGNNGKRNFVAYISEPDLGVLPTPEIKNVELKAYNDGNEIFPWYKEETKLVASYDASDENIFQKNYAWYCSKERDEEPIKNPNFSVDYDIFKSGNGVDKGQMPISARTVEYNQLTNKRYYYYSITPYSEFGRLGKMAINLRRLLVIERTDNEYWNNLIEDAYLAKIDLKLSPQVLTMNNIEEPTLNVESDISTKDNEPLLFYSLPEGYKTNTNSFQTIVETQFTEKALGEEAGFGVFLGNYDNEKEDGIIYLADKTNNSIDVKKISNGNKETIKSFNLLENFDWSKRYKWNFEILRGEEKDLKVSYKDINDSKFIELEGQLEGNTINLNFHTNHIGLKTWSNYDFEDKSTEEHKYIHNLTVDFYDINFYDINFAEIWSDGENEGFYQGGGNSSNINNKGAEAKDLRIKMSRENTRATGNTDPLTVKALWFTENANLTIGNNDTLKIKVEESVRFDSAISFGNNDAAIEISGINNSSYPIEIYFKENQKVRFKEGEEYKISTLTKDDYIEVNSKVTLTRHDDNTIYIEGDYSIATE